MANLEDAHPVPAPVPHALPDEWDIAGSRLWPLVMMAASKGKLVPPAEAETLLGKDDLEAVDKACGALQRWCWVHGLPPIDRAVAHPRVKGPLRQIVDYDVFFEAMGVDVSSEHFVLGYPWRKVKEPSPEELARARHILAASGPMVRSFRFLDLELDLREADAARGRKRPVPAGHESWEDVTIRHRSLLNELQAAGIKHGELRPPGNAPYPPPAPRVSTYSH